VPEEVGADLTQLEVRQEDARYAGNFILVSFVWPFPQA